MYIYIYIYVYTHTHTHTYIYIYTHTHTHIYIYGLPRWPSGNESTYQCIRQRHGFDPWVCKIPWRRKWQPILAETLLSHPEKCGGQESPMLALAEALLMGWPQGTWLTGAAHG